MVEPAYSITWSARSRMDCEIVRPRALAVFRLITNSNSLVWLTRGFRKRSTSVGGETVRKLVAVSLLAVALLLIQASASHAAGPEFPKPPGFRGHPGFPGPPRFHGHFRGDGDFRGDGVIVVGPSIWWDPWWYYPPPYYYPPPQVVVEPVRRLAPRV